MRIIHSGRSRRSPERLVRDGLAGEGFALSAPVGPGQANAAGGVFAVETVLNGAGLLNRAPGGVFGQDTADAIRAGQRRLNRDFTTSLADGPLKIDGLINPEGPTRSATRALARDVNAQWRAHRTQKPAEAPERNDAVDTLHAYRNRLSADDISSLHRNARGMSRYKTPGAAKTDEERKSVLGDAAALLKNPDNARRLRDKALADLEAEAERTGMASGEFLARRLKIGEAFPETRDENGDVQVAIAPALVLPLMLGGTATAAVAGKYMHDNWRNLGLDRVFGAQPGLRPAEPLPPVPGSEPHDLEFGPERFPDLGGEDHAPNVPNLGLPKSEIQLPPFPDQGEEFSKPQIQEIRETKPQTIKQSLDEAVKTGKVSAKMWRKMGKADQKTAKKPIEMYEKGLPDPGIGSKKADGDEEFLKLRDKNGTRVIIKNLGKNSFDVVGAYKGHVKSDKAEGKTVENLIDEYKKRRN